VITLPITIAKSEVLRYLGIKIAESQKLPPVLEKQVDMAIWDAYEIAEPQISYDFFNIVADTTGHKILLKRNYSFSGEYIFNKLKMAEEVVVAILTIGNKVEDKGRVYFSQGDYLLGMIYDAIGSAALEDLKQSFFNELCKRVRAEQKGITCGLSPGSQDWSIQDQAVIFKLLDAKSIGVTLMDSMMMVPLKSISVVYGIGKGLAMSENEHDCSNCSLVNCTFRAVRSYEQ